ncbi:MAG: ferrous iron transport protein A [Spirochaetia bacterium]
MDLQIRSMKPGNRAEVVGFDPGSKPYRDRLMSMGLTKGTVFTLLKIAPLGDPVEIEVRGFKLSLRKKEADALKIRGIEE